MPTRRSQQVLTTGATRRAEVPVNRIARRGAFGYRPAGYCWVINMLPLPLVAVITC
jgi:hypothetical protein